MKKAFAVLSFSVLFVCTALLLSFGAAQKGKVLMVVTAQKTADLAIEKEVGVMKDLLEKEGFTVVIGSPAAQPLVGESKTVKADSKLDNVKIADYAGLIIPCLAGANLNLPPDLVPQLKNAIAKGMPVAAQRTGMLALIRADLLSGRKVAKSDLGPGTQTKSGSKPLPDDLQRPLKDTIDGGTGIVQDKNLITSAVCPMVAQRTGLPDGTPGLTKALIAQIKQK